jgi:hypothetical protein
MVDSLIGWGTCLRDSCQENGNKNKTSSGKPGRERTTAKRETETVSYYLNNLHLSYGSTFLTTGKQLDTHANSWRTYCSFWLEGGDCCNDEETWINQTPMSVSTQSYRSCTHLSQHLAGDTRFL